MLAPMRSVLDALTAIAWLVALLGGAWLLWGLVESDASRSFAVVAVARFGVPIVGVALAAAVGLTWGRTERPDTRRVTRLVLAGLLLSGALLVVREGPRWLAAIARRRPAPALHRACDARDAARVRSLLAGGASPLERDARGLTAVRHAALHGSPEVLEAFAARSVRLADPELFDDALSNPDPAVVPWFVDHVLSPGSEAAARSLALAACRPDARAVRALLARGVPAEPGFVAAVRCGTVSILEAFEVSPDVRQRALAAAIDAGATASAEALLARGARLDVPVAGDRWPLAVALERRDPELVTLLLAHGAGLPERSFTDEVRSRGASAVAEELLESD